MSSVVRAQDLLRALVHLAPERKDVIFTVARETELELLTFCRGIRETIGGTLLFDAVMLLRGSKDLNRDSGAAMELYEHCLTCQAPSCSRQDCLELRGMLSSLKAHWQSCDVPKRKRCRTCLQWQAVRDRMKSARAERQESLHMQISPPTTTGHRGADKQRPHFAKLGDGDTSPRCSAAGAALLMLSRSALAPINPPENSPSNSPSGSPRLKRSKKVCGPSPLDGSHATAMEVYPS